MIPALRMPMTRNHNIPPVEAWGKGDDAHGVGWMLMIVTACGAGGPGCSW
jgi:hypothetical protein